MKATDKPNIVTLVWVCLGLAACVAPRHLMPVLPDLVGSWRLIHFVVDGQIQPAPGDEYTVKITPDHTYLSRPLDRVRRIRYIEWSDGCNTNWVAFRATRFGRMRTRGMIIKTALTCVDIDKETGARTYYTQDKDILLWPSDAVAYEMRDGELWLYTSRDKSNALVLHKAQTP